MAENDTTLGRASGRIEIDITQVEQAGAVVRRVAEQMTAAMQALGKGSAGGGVSIDASVLNGLTRVQQAVQQANAATATSAEQMVSTVARTAQTTAQVVKQASEQAAQASEQAAERVERAGRRTQQTQRSAGGAGGNPNRPTTPTFIQFALYPASGLAQQLGAPGVSNALMGAGNFLGVADNLSVVGEAIRRLSTNLQGMGGIVGSIASRAATATAGLGATASGLASIVAVAAPVAVVLAGLSLVLGEMQRRSEEARRATKAYVDALIEVRTKVTQGATTGELSQQAATANAQLSSRGQFLTQYRDLIDRYNQVGMLRYSPAGGALIGQLNEQASARSGGQFTSIEALVEEFNRVQTEALGFEATLKEIEKAFRDPQVAANDAAEAARKAAAAEDELAQARLQAVQRGRGMSNDELEQEIRDLEQQFYDIGRVLDSNTGISEDYRNQLIAQQDALAAQAAAYEAMKSPLQDFLTLMGVAPDQLRKAGAGISGLVQGAADAVSQFVDLKQQFDRQTAQTGEDRAIASGREFEDYGIARIRRQQDFDLQLAQAEEDFYARQAQAREDFAREQAEQEQETRDRRAELQAEYDLEVRRAEEDHQIAMARIQRDGRIAVLESAAQLDARAVFEQQRATRIQLADEQEDYDLERQRRAEDFALQLAELLDAQEEQRAARQEDFERQLADAERQYQLQRQRQIAAFNEQLRREDADRALRLQRQQADYALQDARRQQDYQRQIQQLIAHNTVMLNAQTAYQNTALFSFGNFWTSMIGSINSAAANVARSGTDAAGAGSSSGRVGASVTQYALGTNRVPRTGLAKLHEGEAVLSPEVAALYRRALGSDFSQAEAARALTRGSGDGATVWNGNVIINGDVGDYSETDLTRVFANGLEQFFARGATRTQARRAS